jgi:3-(3-hydroxy-phenyl)propionate hydroxylase
MFVHPRFAYRRAPDRDRTAEHQVVVIGAGLVGLTLAIDLAQHGIDVVALDDDDTVSVGSRSICQAKRTLEIWDRLDVAAPMLAKGITWTTGKVFFGERQVYGFDLQPEGGHKFPAFINLQQYYVEHFLVQRAQQEPRIDLRWKNRVNAVETRDDLVLLTVDTPEGPYRLAARYVIACDGVRSPVRHTLGLDFRGKVFEDRFLIADVRMQAAFPTERWFWFEPPFHRGGSTLLHRQADDVWRIDFQLGWDAAPEAERKPERVIPRIQAMLGPQAKFELEWVSVYTFQCRRLERFRHGRVIFAGDSAHTVSPFGARGGNGGVQDSDNLAWKLALVLRGEAPDSLLDSYDAERIPAADENILNSTRATDFITPKSAASRLFRDAALTLSAAHPFARRLVNSGRLSAPAIYRDSPLSTPDEDEFAGGPPPGSPVIDAPLDNGFLCERLRGQFTLLAFDTNARGAELIAAPCRGAIAERYDARPGTVYLFRPDQHVAARWRRTDPDRIARAIARAKGGKT